MHEVHQQKLKRRELAKGSGEVRRGLAAGLRPDTGQLLSEASPFRIASSSFEDRLRRPVGSDPRRVFGKRVRGGRNCGRSWAGSGGGS